MKKKVVSLLAAMALAVTALAGCGSNDAATTGTDAATVAATTEAAGEGSGAYTGTPIKIGGIAPTTPGAPPPGVPPPPASTASANRSMRRWPAPLSEHPVSGREIFPGCVMPPSHAILPSKEV